MERVTHEKLYQEIRDVHIVLLGIPGSEAMGLYGEVRDAKKLLKELNGTVKSDHAWLCALRWMVGLVFVGLLACITGQIGIW